MSLLVSLRAERLKIKRSASFYLAFCAAAFTPLVNTLDLIFDGVGPEHRKVIFNEMFTERFGTTGAIAFPIFIILICTLLPQTEYKNNTWKQVLTSPQSKSNVFLAKFINIQLLILAFFIINLLFMFICALAVHFKNPSLNLLSQPFNGYGIAMLRINTYLVLLSLCALQYWLGLQFKSFIIPIGTGVALYFAGTLLVMQLKQSNILYLPYTMFLYNGLPEFTPYVSGLNWYSLAYTVVFLAIGFLSFRKKRMIG